MHKLLFSVTEPAHLSMFHINKCRSASFSLFSIDIEKCTNHVHRMPQIFTKQHIHVTRSKNTTFPAFQKPLSPPPRQHHLLLTAWDQWHLFFNFIQMESHSMILSFFRQPSVCEIHSYHCVLFTHLHGCVTFYHMPVTTFQLSNLLLVDIWVVSSLGLLGVGLL